jgi:tetratricopeptide (TPR) repeat protein
LDSCKLFDYFEQIQIQHSPEYSYGESVVVLDSESSDRFSLLQSYKSIVEWLSVSAVPWEDPQRARDRRRLEWLKEEIELSQKQEIDIINSDGSSRRHIDILQEISSLSTTIFGRTSPSSLSARHKLIEATLVDSRDRSLALELLNELVGDFTSLPTPLRWSSAECLLQSAATLRKLGSGRRANRLTSQLKQLLKDDAEFKSKAALGIFMSVARRLQARGSWFEAKELLALIIEQASNIEDVREVGIDAMNNLAFIYQVNGDVSGAIALARQALDLVRGQLGDDSVETMAARGVLIAMLSSQDDLVEVQEQQERVVGTSQLIFGEIAPETLEALSKLATTLVARGEVDRDEELLSQGIKYMVKAKGADHVDTIAAREKLALIQSSHQELREALSDLDRLRRLVDNSLGRDALRRELSGALQRLGDAQLRQNELESAMRSYLEASRIELDRPDFDPSRFLSILDRIGDILSGQERYKEFLGYCLEAFNAVTRLLESARASGQGRSDLLNLRSEIQERMQETRVQTVADGRL